MNMCQFSVWQNSFCVINILEELRFFFTNNDIIITVEPRLSGLFDYPDFFCGPVFSWILISFDFKAFIGKKMFNSRKVCLKQRIYRFAFKGFSARRQRAFWCIQLNFDWFSIVLLLRECHAIFISFVYIVVSLILILFSIIRTFYWGPDESG